MNIFSKVAKKFGLVEEKSKTEIMQEKRDNLKLTIAVKLYEKGCSDSEIEQVLSIIQNAEDDIQIIKNSLIGTNINPQGDPNKPLHDGILKIRARQEEMQKELNEAIQNILANKNK
ncbi:MAG: hypothetical protein IKU37_00935 [Candidatus Gastranaerophilales bacterium]|nr:hypothetical protein [Candidatus Gastranaerophilales bacterium]